jgi:HPt (histidine-containing phosphotransfer) domain-containing protein
MDSLDVSRLHQLRTDLDDDRLLAEVLGEFLRSTPALIRLLRDAIGTSDSSAVAPLAHRLKGGAAQLGASRLAALCAELERTGNGPDSETGQELERLITEEFGAVAAALCDYARSLRA